MVLVCFLKLVNYRGRAVTPGIMNALLKFGFGFDNILESNVLIL